MEVSGWPELNSQESVDFSIGLAQVVFQLDLAASLAIHRVCLGPRQGLGKTMNVSQGLILAITYSTAQSQRY